VPNQHLESQIIPPPSATAQSLQHASSQGFAHTFGIHPAIAVLTLAIDTMLFGGEILTLGAGELLSIVVAAVLGIITYKAQRKWYGDDKESALIKALILALLTAIPTALPAFLYVPAGVVGIFGRKKN